MAEHVVIEVEGMGCEGCVASVRDALMKVEGVRAAEVDLGAGRARVEHEGAATAALVGAVERAGYDARALAGG